MPASKRDETTEERERVVILGHFCKLPANARPSFSQSFRGGVCELAHPECQERTALADERSAAEAALDRSATRKGVHPGARGSIFVVGSVQAGSFTLGRYECFFLLGRGGMAEVWAAKARGARGFQKLVALKTLLPAMLEDPSTERMFLDEATLASRIRHPNAIEVLDLGEEDGRLFIAMEYVDGGSLSDVARLAKLPLPLPIAVPIIAAACRGLQAAHDLCDEHGQPLGIVHRDVSPHNILLGRDGAIKVADFGIAKAMAKSSGTDIGIVKGKPSYMAPEQARGEHLDRRADVFALGVMLYELTTGRHPFRGPTTGDTAAQLMRGDWPAPSTLVRFPFPKELERTILEAMAPAASDRTPSASRLEERLNAFLRKQGLDSSGEIKSLVERHLGPELRRREQALRALGPTPKAVVVVDTPAAQASTLTRSASSIAARPGTPRQRGLARLAAGALLASAAAWAAYSAFFSASLPVPGGAPASAPSSAAPLASAEPRTQASSSAPPAPSASADALRPAASTAKVSAPRSKSVPRPRPVVTAPERRPGAVPVHDPGF